MSYDAIHPNPQIATRLKSIYDLHRKDNDFRLERSPYNELLSALGDPHLNLPPTIHLAGTNGKGSTIAFLKSVYESQGHSVHTYTSPHLLTFNERITLSGESISDDRLLHYLDEIDAANNGRAVTFFEYTTALAFKAMADTPADLCILETGLGGRLDCTNIIENPIATIITAIGYDHMDFLGHSITDIAQEKAGIIKENVPCIVAPQIHPETHTVFKEKSKDVHFVETRDDLPHLGLVGDHQKQNASTALATIDLLQNQFSVTDNAIQNGLKNARWAGRMEHITQGALYDSLPPHCELWFDCGHNAEGARAISTQLKAWKDENPARDIHLVLGLATDKNPNDFLSPLLSHINSLTCVDLLSARNPQTAQKLKEKVDLKQDIKTEKLLRDVAKNIQEMPAILFITGSVYLYRDLVT
ncbi:MAG: bifunctional folylpolyglutamate synthase/dihydrofolate synthase [Alphaproteobacteria bacterium]|nr:MAG: bifunctional folylpolyglutamate synthase/dihydrofolate synthase [Alphaproteobacteria bacterium]